VNLYYLEEMLQGKQENSGESEEKYERPQKKNSKTDSAALDSFLHQLRIVDRVTEVKFNIQPHSHYIEYQTNQEDIIG
jgi:hypothetical protein